MNINFKIHKFDVQPGPLERITLVDSIGNISPVEWRRDSMGKDWQNEIHVHFINSVKSDLIWQYLNMNGYIGWISHNGVIN